ncbi:type II secretion system F family protein [Luethyella okanaganae]|uniref:Type II secretion system F family protein n=1 Tax=Luethyella okanaganae TaxID=69372 RepID=A0ABW1VBR9_9MICO
MRSAPPAMEAVAAVTQRLAVLLAAGVPPQAVWRYLDAATASKQGGSGATVGHGSAGHELGAVGNRMTNPTAAVIGAAERAGALGEGIADAIASAATEAVAAATPRGSRSARREGIARAWLALAAAWAVATESGAPLAACLRELAASFRAQAQLERDLEVALAGPRATARLVGAMPAIGVLFGSIMGFNTVETLFTTVPGLLCLATGSALMLSGARWSGALVRRAGADPGVPGLSIELTAIAMSGGASTERARELARTAMARYSGTEAPRRAVDDLIVEAVLALSRRAGVPAVELLRSEAEGMRLDARSDGQRRAARLAVALMIPLGLCVLPAFMLLGVAPLLLAVVSSTFAGF